MKLILILLILSTYSPLIFSPLLQPTCLQSKTLIDNIFVNSVEFKSHSGNLSILLSDHFSQFVILEIFFKNTFTKNPKIRERSFRNLNEREFNDILADIDWDPILQLNIKDPNLAINNLHNKINFTRYFIDREYQEDELNNN